MYRCKTVRLYVVSEEFYEETSFKDAHEFSHRLETVHMSKLRFSLLAE